jgi:hypothetical protein
VSSTSASAGFAEAASLAANITTYDNTGLTSNTQYWWRVRAHNASGYSAYSNVVTGVTFAAIAAPTNLVAVAISDTEVDIYFDDNSELEDDHRLERKTGAGAYSEIVTLEPNRNCYRNTGLSAGTAYTYKVRAKQGGSYSGYSNEATVTTLAVPGKLTYAGLGDYQDTWIEWTWYGPVGAAETGFKIERSDDGGAYAQVAQISDGYIYYSGGTKKSYTWRDTGLTRGVYYAYKARGYNGAGDGAYETIGAQATRSAYLPSSFDRLIHKSKPAMLYLVEANPGIILGDWSLTATMTYTYEATFDERGAELESLFENGDALLEVDSVATVESTAGSWYYSNGKVYVHPTDSDSAINYIYLGKFWVYYTTGSAATVYNAHQYLPLVAADGIPDISQEIQRCYEGNFSITSGSISLINGKIAKQNHFDKKFEDYVWLNAKFKVLAGGTGFTYSEFVPVNTGIVNSYSVTDQRATFNLRDLRDGIHRTLPISKFTLDEFPRLASTATDRVRPFGYGAITNAVPTCIDTTNRVFEFHNGRIKSVEYLYQNDTELTVNTDYFIDYQRGRVVLARGLTYDTNDIMLVNFTGQVDDADDAIQTGAGIFQDLCTRFLSIQIPDLDLDSIRSTAASKTTALSMYFWKDVDSQEAIRRIEHSIQSDTFQNAEGQLGIKAQLGTAPSGIKYIDNCQVFDFEMQLSRDDVYSHVEVSYLEDPSNDKFSVVTKANLLAIYKFGVNKTLQLTTALTTAAQANTLASGIISAMMKPTVRFTVNRSLFGCMPGDLIYFNRARYFGAAGAVSNKLLRIMSIGKSQSGGRTTITAEEV